jgi:hypothetical protein
MHRRYTKIGCPKYYLNLRLKLHEVRLVSPICKFECKVYILYKKLIVKLLTQLNVEQSYRSV